MVSAAHETSAKGLGDGVDAVATTSIDNIFWMITFES